MTLRAVMPTLLTTCNLIIGILAILWAGQKPADAALLVVAGMVLDGLDGRVARLLHAESEFGKEMDSLSDIVTFGIAPALIMYHVVLNQLGWAGMVVAALFPVCGALRLARFNVQKKETDFFIGLPITAAGGLLATMALYRNLLTPAEVILPLGMMILSLLMVSSTRYPNFKRLGLPKSAIIGVPVAALLVFLVFRYEHAAVNRLVFVPLALYALLGLSRALRRRRRLRYAGTADEERPAPEFKP
jgi:CDP-diacylglycerol--serine O-phosphatidyltransferase